MWSKTTGAADRFWDYDTDRKGALADIRAVGEDGSFSEVAWGLYEPDADWITAVHGCFPDLIRRIQTALDEADAADYRQDERECRIAELELEVAELKEELCQSK